MVKRDEITQFVETTLTPKLLQKAWAKDEVANGVQIVGQADVAKIALGVSLNLEFLETAVKWGAQYCLFHHGLDPRTYLSRLPIYLQKELKLIFVHELTIAGFHYALDAQPEIGNNAQIIKLLGAHIKQPLFDEWGYTAVFDKPVSITDLKTRCRQLFDHEIMHFPTGHSSITTIGVVSGGAKPHAMDLEECLAKGIEIFISGETSESIPHKLVESGIDYFVCGHYATETFGIKALGEKLKTHFGNQVEVEFIDIPSIL